MQIINSNQNKSVPFLPRYRDGDSSINHVTVKPVCVDLRDKAHVCWKWCNFIQVFNNHNPNPSRKGSVVWSSKPSRKSVWYRHISYQNSILLKIWPFKTNFSNLPILQKTIELKVLVKNFNMFEIPVTVCNFFVLWKLSFFMIRWILTVFKARLEVTCLKLFLLASCS